MHKTSARCALCELVKCLLQPLRIAYNKPIVVTSGYRSPEVNRFQPACERGGGRLLCP